MWNVIVLSKVVVLGCNLGRLKHVVKLLTAYRCEEVEHDKRENCKCPNTFTRRYTWSVVMSYNNGFYSASVTSGFVFTLLTLRRNAIPSDVAGFGPRHSRSGMHIHLGNTRIHDLSLETKRSRANGESYRLSLSIVESFDSVSTSLQASLTFVESPV